MKVTTKGKEDTKRAAQVFLENLLPKETATVIALEGELGSGKTNFVQAVGKLLNVKENMHSPTFVIMKAYEIEFKGFTHLIHIDAYRLEKEEELSQLGWGEMLRSPNNLIFVEWPERVPSLIPAQAQRISFVWVDEGVRGIIFHE